MQQLISIIDGVPRHPERRMAKPLTLSIMDGEQVAIVGDNASGKSRLVDILIGRLPLLRTEVQYDFTPSPFVRASENIKYISFRDSYGDSDSSYYYQQRWNQHDIDPETPTVGAILEKTFATTQTSDTATQTYLKLLRDRLYELFRLQPLLDKYVISLSSGELRKLQLVKALLTGPRVLIIDNPFIGLDSSTRSQLRQLLETMIGEMHLSVILVLSRTTDIPDFVTHVIPVEQGCKVMPKMTVEAFRQQACPTATLNPDIRQWLQQLPEKKLNDSSFYQLGGEILRFQGVSIRYGNRTILDHLDWTIHEGERWALLGDNGSGKSTLLSLVCADNPQAYACNIALFGHPRGKGESIWDIKRHIGYVSPEMHRAYMKDLPAIDIVASGLNDSIGLYVRPRPEQRETCLSWMRVFGVEALADRSYLQLSSGEQRLCLLARAFVKDPELLILDEPLHGLDTNHRAKVREIINLFCQRPHKTLIMVTHYEDELPSCIDHHLRIQRPNQPQRHDTTT